MTYMCPVCGFPSLDDEPRAANTGGASGVDLQRNRNARLAGSGRPSGVLGGGVRTSLTCAPVRSHPRSVTVMSRVRNSSVPDKVKSGRQSLIWSPWKRS
jgi:hypothetical protein